jgi:hypothetical protein
MPIIAGQIHTPALQGARHRRAARSLSLQRTSTGWALFDEQGHVVFEARGRDARRLCLARAVDLGVLHIRFDEQPRAAA